MPLINPARTFDNPKDAWDPSFGLASKLLLFVALGTMCLLEATVIRGLWFKHRASSDIFDQFYIPILVLFPSLMALVARLAVRRLSKKGEIQPTAAGRIQQIIGVLTLMAYLAMLQLANIAFH
jgi:hypothetical protein